MKKANLVFGIFLVIALMSVVAAYDADAPYTVTMQWVVPSDTTFTVALCGAETTIDFDGNLSSQTQAEVEPDCQNAPASIPIMNITNSGNVALNFTTNITATGVPSWAVLYVSNDSDFHGSVEIVNVTPVTIANYVAVSGVVETYFWTNVTSATQGTTQRTLGVFSEG